MTKVSKHEVAKKVAAQVGLPIQKIEDTLDAIFDCVKTEVAGGSKVSIYGFGTFDFYDTKERQAHNPANPAQKVVVPAGKRVRFKASSTFGREVA